MDNHSAPEMGHLREGTRSFEVRRPTCEECSPEASIREGPKKLTLRAEEVGTQKSCTNVDHVAQENWRPPLVDADWHAFCQTIYKGIEREDWEDLYEHYKEMSKAAGVKKPNENQRAKAVWKMKAAKDREEDFYDPERKENILERSKTRLELWEEHLEDPIVALDRTLKCVENSCWRVCWPENLVEGDTHTYFINHRQLTTASYVTVRSVFDHLMVGVVRVCVLRALYGVLMLLS